MPTPSTTPRRGEVWYCDLDPTQGHEQRGRRPCVVVSHNGFNRSGAGLVLVLPITSKGKPLPFRVAVQPPEGGLAAPSFVLCEALRSVSITRLQGSALGTLRPETMEAVETTLRHLLAL